MYFLISNLKVFLIFFDKEFTQHNESKTGCKTIKYYVQVVEKNQIIGASQGGIFNSALYISDFIIKEDFRKTGIGKKLINEIEIYARKNNCTKIWVDTYSYQAPDFYRRNGFIEKGRIEKYRGEHAKIFFEKET